MNKDKHEAKEVKLELLPCPFCGERLVKNSDHHGEWFEHRNAPMSEYQIESMAFESIKPDRGYTVKASFLKAPHNRDAMIEIFKDDKKIRDFLFPAYKVWNIAAHFSDIVDGEIENSDRGYQMAGWNGIENGIFFIPHTIPNNREENGK